ncbi:MAG: nitroreductase family protein [Rikenellaceae bacterium]
MEAIKALMERRSVRKYKDQKVDRQTIEEIMELTRWAPSWCNLQVARYTIIDDEAIIKRIAEEGVKGFTYNIKTLVNAKGVAVQSFKKGKSGKLGGQEYTTESGNVWEIYDAGISCQQFCLAAHAKGVGTCVMGVIDDKEIAKIINLPEDETVASVIVFGYEEGEHAKPTDRFPAAEITRYL